MLNVKSKTKSQISLIAVTDRSNSRIVNIQVWTCPISGGSSFRFPLSPPSSSSPEKGQFNFPLSLFCLSLSFGQSLLSDTVIEHGFLFLCLCAHPSHSWSAMKLLFSLIFEILRKHMFDTCTAGQNGDELLRKERERGIRREK